MQGKSVIVYYSWIGSTAVVAQEIQRISGFDIQRIEEMKTRSVGKIAGAAMSAFLGLKSRIRPMDYELAEYKNIFLGVQVWAGKPSPAINKYLSKVRLKDKKVWLFITKGDESVPQRFIDVVTKRIEGRGGKVMGNISITTKWNPETNIPISLSEVEEIVQSWLSNEVHIEE